MSPEGSKWDWWTREQASKQPDTFNLIEAQKDSATAYLDSKGYTGYALGKPTLCGWTFLQIGVLDPQQDVPNQILVFAKNRQKIDQDETLLEPLSAEQYKYAFDSSTNRYTLEFKISTLTYKDQSETSYTGEFDSRGNILNIREMAKEEM